MEVRHKVERRQPGHNGGDRDPPADDVTAAGVPIHAANGTTVTSTKVGAGCFRFESSRG